MKNIGARATEIITANNLNITKVAERIGIARETLSRVVNQNKEAGGIVLTALQQFIQDCDNGLDLQPYYKKKQVEKVEKAPHILAENEKWIAGFEGKYTVNTNGQVYSIESNKYLKGINNGYGYLQVCLSGKMYHIHRLVGNAFIPNTENKPQINHKDYSKKNNSVDNLEWVTAKENMQHASKMGLHNK